jgi:glycosyltransferase involved in cell wall biosynthesis
MKIGIDGRLIYQTGVGRYIKNLVINLSRIDSANDYILYLYDDSFANFKIENPRWQIKLLPIKWHTLKEQLIGLKYFQRDKLDLLHVPYFNAPFFYEGKFIVTIHDLTILHHETGKATTLPIPIYKLKHYGYRLILKKAIEKSQAIITVSNYIKTDILNNYQVDSNKISVIYEGVEDSMISDDKRIRLNFNPYFLYVGNAYPHKNVDFMIDAFEKFISQPKIDYRIQLILIGPNDYFYQNIKKRINNNLKDRILILHNISDEDLKNYYNHALALVLPSLSEGFGLPALEAMVLGCQVICSDIPIFHEIVSDYGIYFELNNVLSLVQKFNLFSNSNYKPKQINKKSLLQKYSFEKCAKETLALYNRI